jgi:hemerythrin superfamily protein
MDALELLKHDHEMVKRLFKKAGSTQDEKEKRKIFREINSELETHARIEESVFYPAMQEQELKEMVLESLQEHKQVKALLREIKNLKSGSDKFEPKLQVLMDNVQHHAEEEEEGKMFPKIREIESQQSLEMLGEQLEAAKTNVTERRVSQTDVDISNQFSL